MHSKYLESLSKEDKMNLIQKLYEIQNGKCFICGEPIDIKLHSYDIDHIHPLANHGPDAEENFALTHSSCNRSKSDADLKIAQILYKLKKIQEQANNSATLEHVLNEFGGSKYNLKYTIEGNLFKYSLGEIQNNTIFSTPIYTDRISGEKSTFIELPLEYLYHSSINPRGINNRISKLIKEFYKKNPQLQVGLAILHDNKVKIFDGQHKAVAQILLGTKKLILRLFIDPNINRLREAKTNAGESLKQVAFDKSIMRQLNHSLYGEKIKEFQQQHNLSSDDYSFSEQNLVDFFKGENKNIRKYIIDYLKSSITKSPDNKLTSYIDMEGKSKKLPISYSAFDKTFLSLFIDSKKILTEKIDAKTEEGNNKRMLEQSQLIKLMNIIAEEIYCEKFNPEIGISQIEDKIIKGKDKEITDSHLTAYRMSKEEIMHAWLVYIQRIIKNYYAVLGRKFDETSLFQNNFDDQLWSNIRHFVQRLRDLPLWRNKEMAATHFSGKHPYEYWEQIFETGLTPEGSQVLTKGIDILEMIKE